ncbi:MAG: T9SS type A sorting domain-containing protein [Paludibacter sp.]|nr:T9SS type A sorting domain-containing protein [Paludibacter sp.]
MKKNKKLQSFIFAIVMLTSFPGNSQAQVEIPKTNWTASTFRYDALYPPVGAIDFGANASTTYWALRGSSKTNRWFKIDLGASYPVAKITITYNLGGPNFPQGVDIYVTDEAFPFNPATSGSSVGNDMSGDLFDPTGKTFAATITGNTNPIIDLTFPAAVGKYIWIVSNTDKGDWWIINDIKVYKEGISGFVTPNKQSSEIKLFPNPVSANGRLTVALDSDSGELFINDMLGHLVLKSNGLHQGHNIIDINLKSGLYIVSLNGLQSKLTVK